METVHTCRFPAQAPLQERTDPLLTSAVSVTVLTAANWATSFSQTTSQSMPAGLEVTEPEPLLYGFEMLSLCSALEATSFRGRAVL